MGARFLLLASALRFSAGGIEALILPAQEYSYDKLVNQC